MKFNSRSLLLTLVAVFLLLLNSLPAFAYENLPNFSSGQTPRSALTNVAMYSPDVSTITVSWTECKPGDVAVIRYQDKNGCYLPNTEMVMENTSGSTTFTAPAGAIKNTLILGTGQSYGMRYLWYSSITYSDGRTEAFPAPYIPLSN